jgi:phosphoglycolate phosphatase-like HAD superfamily hydrolase
VEWVRAVAPRPGIALVVFDFDGTLSWLRHGWPGIMLRLFQRHFPRRHGETEAEADALLADAILRLNGKPTIFQMIRFADLAAERGGAALDPEALRAEYQRELDEAIARRSAEIRSGESQADDYVVYGARRLVEHLVARRVAVGVLSSTIEERVREEAALLGIAPLFDDRIAGSTGDARQFLKRAVFERWLREAGREGDALLSFGDGPVEIADTKALGGIAVAVCSDEDENGSGRCDQEKRRQLIAAGADMVIPDFRHAIALVDYLFGAA